jgi:acyl-CoA synthetase (AMP-forming)/AMP-acid ligase II
VRVGGAGFETRVVDGILWVRSAYAMLGYLGAPDPFDPDGWFCTEDRVEQEGEWLRILGRDSDLINVAGQKVYPAEIEDCILELEGIEDVAVHAEPHPLLGAIVVARVRTAGVEEAAALKLRVRKHCLASLAPYKVPTRVVAWEGATVSARQKKLRRAG